MSESGPFASSLRQGHRENRRLRLALLISLMAHLAAWGTYELGKTQGWWQRWPVFAWLRRPLPLVHPVQPQAPVDQPPQLQFLAVAEPDAEAPKKPKFYSNNNSHAANETPQPDQDTPLITGRQTEVLRTKTAPRTEITKTKSPPTPPNRETTAAQPQEAQTQPVQPLPVVHAGNLTEGKPQEQPQQTIAPRPRTLAQYHAQHPSTIQGVQSYHPGGVAKLAQSAFDTKETIFGDYDALLEQAVQQKWDDLLNARNFAGDCSGRVTVHFYLHYDGTITEAKLVDPTTVDTTWAYLCMQAITEPAPFAKWPDQMLREIGANTREMTFTFYYYNN